MLADEKFQISDICTMVVVSHIAHCTMVGVIIVRHIAQWLGS